MPKDHKEVFSILFIGFIWGVTNPFLRKGSEDAETKNKKNKNKSNEELTSHTTSVSSTLEEENDINRCSNMNVGQEGESLSLLGRRDHEDLSIDDEDDGASSMNSDFISYGSTSIPNDIIQNGSKRSINNQSIVSSLRSVGEMDDENDDKNDDDDDDDESIYNVVAMMDVIDKDTSTSNIENDATKTQHLQNMENKNNNNNQNKNTFLQSIIQTLLKFKNPGVAIPFLLNQSSALFYYKLLATSDLTSAAYCNALSMVFSALTGHCLGERLDKPIKALIGAFLVTVGVVICMISTDLEEWLDMLYSSFVDEEEEGGSGRYLSFTAADEGLSNVVYNRMRSLLSTEL